MGTGISNWWSKHKEEVGYSFFFALVGYLVGSYIEANIKLGPKVDTLIDKINTTDSILYAHADEAKLAIDHIVYNINDGVDCSVGINDIISDSHVSMSEYMADKLGENETIYLINRRIDGSCISIVPVIVVKGTTENPKDTKFYVSESTLRRLGIEDKNLKRKGVYKMSYKRIKKKK